MGQEMQYQPYHEVYEGRDGKYYWRLVGANHEVVSDGSQGYATEVGALRGMVRTAQIMDELGIKGMSF